MARKRSWITVDLGTAELREQVQRLADDNDRSLSAEVRLAVRERLERETRPKRRRTP